MSRDKINDARMAGMLYALKIVQEKGIEGLKEEIKFRSYTKISIAVDRREADKTIDRIKNCTIDTIKILAIMTLKDEFGFGTKRINQFIKRFNDKTECLVEGYTTWAEQIQAIKEENGIELEIRENN